MHRQTIAACKLLLTAVAVPATPTLAQSLDPHALYERSCGGCHEEHARDFAETQLDLADGTVVGRGSGAPLGTILARGHGGLEAREVEVLVAHLSAIAHAGGLFRTKCRICHDRAVDVARRQLIVRDGRLVGRYTGRDIPAFLTKHGRLTADEVPRIVDMLRRQLQSAPR